MASLCLTFQTFNTWQARPVDKIELGKIERFFRKTFNNSSLRVVARPRKNDSAEVYVGEDFLGLVSLDEEDGERSYAFNMAILDIDLED
jgi:hypothetical protein